MSYVSGENRYQTKLMCLDDYVDEQSTARIIDRFVGGLNFAELGFSKASPNHLGRSSYDPLYMTKLIVYGYENGIRSSRKLEALTHVNIEVMWLMDELKPDFKTIADFRKDNLEPLTSLLSEYNSFAEYLGMFGKELVAIDGTKIKASNNKKNNYSKKKLERNIERNESRIREYMECLAAEDDMEEALHISEEVFVCEEKLQKQRELLDSLDQSEQNEISTVDEDARLMGNNRSGVDMAYNVQASVDSKTHLVCAMDITQNPADHGSLAPMIEKTQEELRKKGLTVLADKGYYGHQDLSDAEETGATAIVSRQLKPGEKAGSKYSIDKFSYDKEKDQYICPAGSILFAHSKSSTKARKFLNKDACKECEHKDACLASKDKFRTVLRRPGNDILDKADARYAEYYELYKQRQQIVEHVFGTVKRSMNGGYFLLRTKEKVKAEASLMFLGYNIKRTKTVLGTERVLEMMDEWNAICRNMCSFIILIAQVFQVTKYRIAGSCSTG